MTFTGERMDNHPDSFLYKVSIARYFFAKKIIKSNYSTLDYGCGSGQGTFLLSKITKKITGFDIDKETILSNKKKYKNIIFLTKVNTNHKFQFITCFEVIEHAENPKQLIKSISNLLNKKGTLILSTPNNYKSIHPSKNTFHLYEFEILELHHLLKKYFKKIEVYGQLESQQLSNKKINQAGLVKKIIQLVFKSIYIYDLKYLHLLQKIEHLSIYKEIGKLQREADVDVNIFSINIKQPFLHPEISIYVCQN